MKEEILSFIYPFVFDLSSVIEVTLHACANSLHTPFYSFLLSSAYLNNIYEILTF